jgi:hypothetical protein
MKNIVQAIKDWLKMKSIVDNDSFAPQATASHITDQRESATRQRVKKAFEQQETAMKSRALKPHDPDCPDPITCKKRKCFKPIPDKIVSDIYEVKKRGE